MIAISGIGWVQNEECGCALIPKVFSCVGGVADSAVLTVNGITWRNQKNAGRFNAATRQAMLATALALHDAGIADDAQKKDAIGILGASPDGCIDDNAAYFTDYLAAGRVMGRGNLFIYTLPTSPLAEVAMHYALQGPLAYVWHPHERLRKLLEEAGSFVLDDQAEAMVALFMHKNATLGFVLKRRELNALQFSLEQTLTFVTQNIQNV